MSQPAALFLAWPPDAGMPKLQPVELTVDELVKGWDSDLQALKRRARLRVVRDEHDLVSAT